MIRVSYSLDPDLSAVTVCKGYQHTTIKSLGKQLMSVVIRIKTPYDNL